MLGRVEVSSQANVVKFDANQLAKELNNRVAPRPATTSSRGRARSVSADRSLIRESMTGLLGEHDDDRGVERGVCGAASGDECIAVSLLVGRPVVVVGMRRQVCRSSRSGPVSADGRLPCRNRAHACGRPSPS
jgi:hypothetical protein